MKSSNDSPGGGLVVRRGEDVVSRSIGGQRLLVPIRARGVDLGRVFTLNGTAAAAWDRFDGSRPLAEVADALAEEYGETVATVLSDLEPLVQALVERGLVRVSSSPG